MALISCTVPFGFTNAQGIQALSGTAGSATFVHGRVLNHATQQPVAGALVYSADERYATLTDDHVSRELIDRDPLNFVPGRQLYGFPPFSYPGTSDFSTATSIQLVEGATFQANLSVERRAYYPVRIPVLNAGTNKKINVQVYPLGNPNPGYSLNYNPGLQRIQGALPDGEYTVWADTEGDPGTTGILNFTVNGRPVTGPHIVLGPNPSITVRLTEDLGHGRSAFFEETPETGERAPDSAARHGTRKVDLRVVLRPVQEIEQGPDISATDGDGTEEQALILENVRPGRYRVEAESSIGYAAEITAGGKDLLRQPLVVGQNSSRSLATTQIEQCSKPIMFCLGAFAGPPCSYHRLEGDQRIAR